MKKQNKKKQPNLLLERGLGRLGRVKKPFYTYNCEMSTNQCPQVYMPDFLWREVYLVTYWVTYWPSGQYSNKK